ncbi:TetR/AcrR family transcriptional regulator [Cellulosimicrobium sp. Marseille-Q4280]|jgi:AcrR family transcriptional regulator|uniref:TetR/AcrR family transcriptional regulator n=1 Tax=Cellulosimicrobium sp. Marseille-Q4280 TaxID=2937992 RepID=UPI0020405462|nr:TetR/AcrR family transcriptional regulator [Cellulosimicrobium sp. Marseille-Q4280]
MSKPDPARRSETSRRAVLTAAFDLLQEMPYPQLSIERIAARAGVGKQTIYRWWPSKAAVLLDAFLLLSESGDGEPPTLPDTGDLDADLRLVLRATVAELNDPRLDRPMRALATEVAHDGALADAYHERLDGPLKEAKRQRLRSAQEAGQLADDLDLDLAVDLIWGPVLNRWLQRSGPLTDEYVDRLVTTALGGMRP